MPIELHIYRERETHNSVGGDLWFNGMFLMFTLEPARVNPVHPGHPCIPAGRYMARLTVSPHLGYRCPELLDVPDRSNIRIHKANWPMQIKGCTAVGQKQDTDFVGESAVAFARLMEIVPQDEPFYVTYYDSSPVQPQRGMPYGAGQQQAA
jgi:hypothetical protein